MYDKIHYKLKKKIPVKKKKILKKGSSFKKEILALLPLPRMEVIS